MPPKPLPGNADLTLAAMLGRSNGNAQGSGKAVFFEAGGAPKAEALAVQLPPSFLANLLAVLKRERQPRGVGAHNAAEPDVGQLRELSAAETAHAAHAS